MHKLLSVVLAVTITVLFIGLLPIHGEEQIYEDVIRLHVIAHSDDEYDQQLKLLVRDAVLEETSALLSDCADKESAERRLKEHLAQLASVAEETLADAGCPAPVQIAFGRENYPTRHYRGISLPAGEYLSLRIIIGEGAGQNWWCVLYPSLCLSAAGEYGVADLGFSGEQYRIIRGTRGGAYEVRFRLLELLSEIS